MNYYRIIITILGVVIVFLSITVYFNNSHSNKNSVNEENLPLEVRLEKSKPLLATDEINFQKQLNLIIKNGDESKCELITDFRYKYACHDLFKSMSTSTKK